MAKSIHKARSAPDDVSPLHQVAALPYRKTAKGEIQVLLLTSRRTHRPIIPKGWCSGTKGWRAAKKEAFEEAGVVGKIKHRPIGSFQYWKSLEGHFALVEVEVFPLRVEKRLKKWPEKRERAAQWLRGDDAALLIDEPQLVSLIRDFCGVTGDTAIVPDRRPKRIRNAAAQRASHIT